MEWFADVNELAAACVLCDVEYDVNGMRRVEVVLRRARVQGSIGRVSPRVYDVFVVSLLASTGTVEATLAVEDSRRRYYIIFTGEANMIRGILPLVVN